MKSEDEDEEAAALLSLTRLEQMMMMMMRRAMRVRPTRAMAPRVEIRASRNLGNVSHFSLDLSEVYSCVSFRPLVQYPMGVSIGALHAFKTFIRVG